jgi:hypothetical protein
MIKSDRNGIFNMAIGVVEFSNGRGYKIRKMFA